LGEEGIEADQFWTNSKKHGLISKQKSSVSIDEIEGERKNMRASGRMNKFNISVTPIIRIGSTLKMNVDCVRDD